MPSGSGFGSVDQLPSGRYRARYPGPDRKRYVAPTTFRTKGDARAWLAIIKSEIVRRAWQPPEAAAARKITFQEYADDWLARREIKPRTRSSYRSQLDKHLLPVFGEAFLSTISAQDVQQWYEQWGTRTPTLRARTYGLLKTICSDAVHEDLIGATPCKVRGAGVVKRVHDVRPATIDEIEILVSQMPGQWRLLILVASWCALRFGEITELRRQDVEVSRLVICIRRGVTHTAEDGYVVGDPKSDAGERPVAVPRHIIPMIEAHLRDHTGAGPSALLFPSQAGIHLASSTLWRHWNKARVAAGRPDLHLHDLRHTGAVLAASTGATLAELMGRLGHSTPAAALRYQHVAAGRDAAIADALSDIYDTSRRQAKPQ